MSVTTSLGYLGQLAPTVITSTTTVVFPTLAKGVRIVLIGGGGGGGGGGNPYGGGGGNPGQCIEFILQRSVGSITITVGTGGAGGNVGSSGNVGITDGSPGTNSSIVVDTSYYTSLITTYTALGGAGGKGGGASAGTVPASNPTGIYPLYLAFAGNPGGQGTQSSYVTNYGSGTGGVCYYINRFISIGSGGEGGFGYAYNNNGQNGLSGGTGGAILQWF